MANFAYGTAYSKYPTPDQIANLFALELRTTTTAVNEGYRVEVSYISGASVSFTYTQISVLPERYTILEAQMTAPGGDVFYKVTGPIPNLTSSELSNFEFWKQGNDYWTLSLAGSVSDDVGNDTVIGSGGADTISLGQGNDSIQSGSGNDLVDPGSGDDTVNTGDGNDTIYVSAGADIIDGGAGVDVLNIKSFSLTSLKFSIKNQQLSVSIKDQEGTDQRLTNIEQIRNERGDLLSINLGSTSADTISFTRFGFGFGGNDYLIPSSSSSLDLYADGGSGQDTLRVFDTYLNLNYELGSDSQTLEIKNSKGTLVASVQNIETLHLNDQLVDVGQLISKLGNDSILGTNAADTIFGLAGNDLIDGADGSDYVNGGVGNDTISGGVGNDTLVAGGGSDLLDGGIGNDRLIASHLSTVTGGSGDDTVVIGFKTPIYFTYSLEDNISNGITLRSTDADSVSIRIKDVEWIEESDNSKDRVQYGSTASEAFTVEKGWTNFIFTGGGNDTVNIVEDRNHLIVASGGVDLVLLPKNLQDYSVKFVGESTDKLDFGSARLVDFEQYTFSDGKTFSHSDLQQYAISSNKLAVPTTSTSALNEGDTFRVNINLKGIPVGLEIPYQITGISIDDVSEPISGTFKVPSTQLISLSFSVLNDGTKEGAETLVFTVAGSSVLARIEDTSIYQRLSTTTLAKPGQTVEIGKQAVVLQSFDPDWTKLTAGSLEQFNVNGRGNGDNIIRAINVMTILDDPADGRQIDPTRLGFWIEQIEEGTLTLGDKVMRDILSGFVYGKEFSELALKRMDTNGDGINDISYTKAAVQLMYRNVLGRSWADIVNDPGANWLASEIEANRVTIVEVAERVCLGAEAINSAVSIVGTQNLTFVAFGDGFGG